MRTTLDLDDDLYQQAKVEAARSGRTVTSLVEDALRLLLARPIEGLTNRRPVRLTTVGGKGTLPGVDLDDSAGLLELMHESGRAAP
jgi:hypothetical protein